MEQILFVLQNDQKTIFCSFKKEIFDCVICFEIFESIVNTINLHIVLRYIKDNDCMLNLSHTLHLTSYWPLKMSYSDTMTIIGVVCFHQHTHSYNTNIYVTNPCFRKRENRAKRQQLSLTLKIVFSATKMGTAIWSS